MNLLVLAEKAVLLALIILIVILIFWKLSRIRKENNQGWKIAKGTEGHYFYCEKIGKEWKEIEFEGKHYAPGFPRHVIYTEKDWSDYPEWVKENHEVIKLRLKKTIQTSRIYLC